MALPEHLFEQLEGRFGRHIWRRDNEESLDAKPSPSTLSLGNEELDTMLPDGGIPRGCVVEFALKGGAAWGTSLALAACRSAQEQALLLGGNEAWCAFVDASRSLHGPGVVQAGVRLDRLLVVVPKATAVAQAALRIANARIFAVTIVDIRGIPGAWLKLPLTRWPRTVRQLAMAGEESQSTVVLLSDAHSRRPLPLPVALRLELDQPRPHELGVRVVKERHGRLSNRRVVRYQQDERRGGESDISEDRLNWGKQALEPNPSVLLEAGDSADGCG